MRWALLLFLFGAPTWVLADSPDASVETGEKVFSQTCIACHGANGKGTIPGVKNMNTADGPLSKSDEELITSITDGFQSPGSPLAMPAKGGNPGLTEADIQAVLAYLRRTFGTAATKN